MYLPIPRSFFSAQHSGRVLWLVLVVGLIALFGGTPQVTKAQPADPAAENALGHSGYLIISSARDSTAGYTWQKGPGPGQLSLTWRAGMLTIPETLVLEPFSVDDLAIPVTADFSAAGSGGQLEWKEGSYKISEPLVMSDGIIDFLVSKGELEILASRIRYSPPEGMQEEEADPRASFLMLAGFLLLIGVLLRRARRKIKDKL